MKLTVICVGKLKEAYFREACAEYQKRLTPYAQLSILEVEEYRLPSDPSGAQIAEGLEREGRRILDRLPDGAALASLCVEGKPMTSESFSRWLFSAALGGINHFVFAIGGSFGLSEEIKARSRLRLSLSNMTYPHMLARVMLCEQLYRAVQIERNTKYHK